MKPRSNFHIAKACLQSSLPKDKPAIVFINKNELKKISIEMLRENAGKVASYVHQLNQKMGSDISKYIFVLLPNQPDFLYAVLGILQAGNVAVILPYSWTEEEVRQAQKRIGSKIIFTNRFDVSSYFEEVISLNENFYKKITPLENFYGSAEDEATLIFTSGTTSAPKAVVHAHRALLGRLPAIEYWAHLEKGDTVLHTGSLNWTYTFGLGFTDPLMVGATSYLFESPPSTEELILALE
ncbi:MAG: long-chain fatty acid--CoA ligase, partial [Candidatus Hydrogenedentota bacterium]